MRRFFIIRYKYIDKSLRERFGSIPITYNDDTSRIDINDYIYDQVETHLDSIGINIRESNINVRSCFAIDDIYEFQRRLNVS